MMNLSINTQIEYSQAGNSVRHLYQVKHDYQLPKGVWRQFPEVFRLEPHHYTDLTEAWQLFCFDLLIQSAGDIMTEMDIRRKFRAVYKYDLAMTNDNGFENGDDPRADFINRVDLKQELPKIATLVMGGTVLSGVIDGTDLIVDTLDGNRPPPSGITRKTHPWLIQCGTNATLIKMEDGTFKVNKFTQLNGADVLYPIIARITVRFPLSGLVELPIGAEAPSPYNPPR